MCGYLFSEVQPISIACSFTHMVVAGGDGKVRTRFMLRLHNLYGGWTETELEPMRQLNLIADLHGS